MGVPPGRSPQNPLGPEFHSVMGEVGEGCSASQLHHVIGPSAVLSAPSLYLGSESLLGFVLRLARDWVSRLSPGPGA